MRSRSLAATAPAPGRRRRGRLPGRETLRDLVRARERRRRTSTGRANRPGVPGEPHGRRRAAHLTLAEFTHFDRSRALRFESPLQGRWGVDGPRVRGRAPRRPRRPVDATILAAVPAAPAADARGQDAAGPAPQPQPSRQPPSVADVGHLPHLEPTPARGTPGSPSPQNRLGSGAGRAASRRQRSPTCHASGAEGAPANRLRPVRPEAPPRPSGQASGLSEIALRARKRLHHRRRRLATTEEGPQPDDRRFRARAPGRRTGDRPDAGRRVPIRATA